MEHGCKPQHARKDMQRAGCAAKLPLPTHSSTKANAHLRVRDHLPLLIRAAEKLTSTIQSRFCKPCAGKNYKQPAPQRDFTSCTNLVCPNTVQTSVQNDCCFIS